MSNAVQIGIVRMETNVADNYRQVAFADRDGDPDVYVIMQRAIQPDAQDEELGLSGLYTEVSVLDLVGYDLCERVVWDGRKLTLRFKAGLERNSCDVRLDLEQADYEELELKEYLAFVAQGVFEDATGPQRSG
jgi:hypothetical protein